MDNPKINEEFQNCFERSVANDGCDDKLQDKLRRTRIVIVNDTKKYIELRNKIENEENLKRGKINLRRITSDPNGRISIECDKPKEVSILNEMIKNLGYETKPAISSKFLFKIVGIPNVLGDEDLMKHLARRDTRFRDRTLFCVVKRFKMNDAHDTVVFQALDPLKKQLKERKHVFIGFKKYKVKKFFKLAQCYNCSEFGHNADFCENEPACPNCAGKHDLKKCPKNFIPKCINCTKRNSIQTGHSSMHAGCQYRNKYIDWLKRRASDDDGW